MSPAEPASSGLRSSVRRALGWNSAAQLIVQITQFGSMLLLARLLEPEHFGIYALALVLTTWAGYLAENGFASGLIRDAEITAPRMREAWRLNMWLGTLMAGVLCLTAPLLAALLGQDSSPTSASTLTFAAVAFAIPFQAATSVRRALIRRSLDHRGLFRLEAFPPLLALPVTILLAAVWPSPLSLAVGYLLTELAASAVLYATTGGASVRDDLLVARPHGPGGSPTSLRRYGLGWMVSESVGYWTRNLDNLLVGNFFGPASLGNYTRAFALAVRPISQAQIMAGTVALPTFAAVAHDRARLRTASEGAVAILAIFLMPGFALAAAEADELVRILLGTGWDGVVPLLRAFCVLGAAQAVSVPLSWCLQSVGAVGKLSSHLTVGAAVTYAVAAFAISIDSIELIAIGHVVGALVVSCLLLATVRSLTGFRLSALVPALATASLVVVAAWVVNTAGRGSVYHAVAAGAVAWSVGALVFRRNFEAYLWLVKGGARG